MNVASSRNSHMGLQRQSVDRPLCRVASSSMATTGWTRGLLEQTSFRMPRTAFCLPHQRNPERNSSSGGLNKDVQPLVPLQQQQHQHVNSGTRNVACSVLRVEKAEQHLASQMEQALSDAAIQVEQALSTAVQPAVEQDHVALAAVERRQRKQREQITYQMSALAATMGVTALAIVATYLRFEWHMGADADIPWAEIAATLSLVAGGVFGMEMWARYAHKALWHDYEPGWALHKSHHEPRTGPFEDNDIFAVVNGVPAMLLCLYGFLTSGIPGGLCFGAGLGITLFGIMYMFVHDGLVHRRFPVGPLAHMPYMKKIAIAHQLHHAEKYGGAPWGMFLGPQELEAIPGASEELERMVADLDWSKR